MLQLEKKCETFLAEQTAQDSAHDLLHTKRVVANAKKLLKNLSADRVIVLAAAWLHDCVVLPKNHPDRKKASLLAGEKAADFLREHRFPDKKVGAVVHAIEAHSFSAGIKPQTIEAKIVQDADRLDALGAIGIARCFAVGGQLERAIYHTNDPFCKNRQPDDTHSNVDHFYTKLFRLPDTMNTENARKEAVNRVKFMKDFLKQLEYEIED